MVSARMFRSAVGLVLGVLLCLSCTWPVICSTANSSKIASVPPADLCYYDYCDRGTCLNIKGSPVCFCREHFTGSRCQYIDPCRLPSINPCGSITGHCRVIEQENSVTWRCGCIDGFTGEHCETRSLEQSLCTSVTCMNGGTCYHDNTTADGTYCICHDHYYGAFCEDFITCSGTFCENGGTCNYDHGEIVCLCPHEWRGKNCNISKNNDPCASWNPCLNGGTCYFGINDAFCTCQEGFIGDSCEFEDRCIDWTCQNGGSCNSISNVAVCHCATGWFGDQCEIYIDTSCDGVRCLNGGACETLGGGKTKCNCLSGFTGKHCETYSPTKCAHLTCHNGGSCLLEDWGEEYCQCEAGWHGHYCEKDEATSCNGLTCLNGGTCRLALGGGETRCICPVGYTGTSCETSETPSYYDEYPSGAQSSGLGLIVGLLVAFLVLILVGLKVAFIIWRVSRNRRPELLLAETAVHTIVM